MTAEVTHQEKGYLSGLQMKTVPKSSYVINPEDEIGRDMKIKLKM